MAIKPTPNNNLYKGLVFDGVDSRDYGIYITGDAVFNSPERDVEMIEIPGRNGAYALDKGRFGNIEVSYPAGMFGDTEADFRQGISALRNALASRKGYKRLEDDYNPNEYRMAVYKSGLEVTPTALKAGEFTITFDCQPQRFLKSGEIPRTIGGSVTNTKTESGSIVSIKSDGGDAVTSLIAQITSVQAGIGDPSPTNVRPITGWTATAVNVAGKNLIGFKSLLDNWGSGYTDLGDGSYNVTSTGAGYREPFRFASKDIDVTLSGEITQLSGASGWRLQLLNSNDETVATLGSGSTALSGKGCKLRLNYATGAAGANFKNIQVELGTAATSYEPYKGTTKTTALGRTVYGGTVDIVTGKLAVTHKAETFNGTESWGSEQTSGGLTNYYLNLDNASKMTGRQGGLLDDELLCNWLAPSSSITTYSVYVGATSKYLNCKCSSASDVTAFKSMLTATPLVVVYPLATPQTYQLTAQQVELLTGQNHVWADTGDITITWGDDPNKLVNPTHFESHPLIRVEGHGELSIGDADITLYSAELGRIDLPAKTARQSFTYSQYFTDVYDTEVFTTDFLNNGDKLYWNGGQYYVPFGTTNGQLVSSSSGGFNGLITTPGTYVEPSATSRIDAMDWSTTRYYVGAKVLTPVEFTFGTAKTVTDSAVIDVTYTTENGNTYTRTVTVAMSLTYTGLNNIGLSIRATNSADRAARYNNADHYFGTAPTFYGISTQTPGDLYIDADIGEAYFVAGDAILNANNYVYFVTDLPVLTPGENSVDYTGNITEVEITPRWWEV